ncbi:MAG: alpha-glucan family phosphorylase [Candidatus Bipolaricaulia bacterium]
MNDNTDREKPSVAYFCMEYGLNEDLPLYAGGLGVLAGDIMKTANEMNLPMVGIGILWRQGYKKQEISENGRPYDCYPTNDYIYDYLEDTGVKVGVQIRDRKVTCKVWKLEKGRFGSAPLYLLDTNLEENQPGDRWLNGQLYGWFEEERIAQEMILGIGGALALDELGLNPDIYHFNEGHAVFAALKLISEEMESGTGFEQAWNKVRNRVVFTTHTPVEQGNEVHGLRVLEYMGLTDWISAKNLESIGGAPFNMTAAGLKLSKKANGVSDLHRQTAESMWADVESRAPIEGITNGVNRNSWVDSKVEKMVEESSFEDIWQVHQSLKRELLEFIKDRTGKELNSEKLLIGFARRAAPYKRADLIFSKPDQIGPYLENNEVQLVFAGKAHPLDDRGKEIVSRLVEASRTYPESVVFLEDYDIEIGRKLTRGVDVWLNNPRKPKEASGTSGMKAAMNGILNASILDGWWPEVCRHGENGWQFGDGYTGEGQDEHDLEALYRVLFDEIVPTYYEDREKWTEMMKASIEDTYDRYSAERMLEDYYEKLYLPGD